VVDHLTKLVIKPTFPSPACSRFLALQAQRGGDERRGSTGFAPTPAAYVAQEQVAAVHGSGLG
jgi:uncharacterized circularly permuted ATP-grasp superfamily protein